MILLCLLLLGTGAACAGAKDLGGAAASFDAGMRQYEANEFAAAVDSFKAAVAAAPENDEYRYRLGTAYGRLAEQAGWLGAVKYAKLARRSLERAVALNPDNVAATRDLATYYERAPSFLGGDPGKAKDLREGRARLALKPADASPLILRN